MSNPLEAVDSCLTILDVLKLRAQTQADDLAYVFEGADSLTYARLEHDATRLARGLATLGLADGDVCAIILPPSLMQITLVFAAQKAGGAVVLLDPEAPVALLSRRLIQCRAAIVVSPPKLKGQVEAEPSCSPRCFTPEELENAASEGGPPLPGITPDHIAYLQFTSGTTGEPKAVVILHRQLMAYLDSHYHLEERPDADVFLCWVPIFHDMGLVGSVYLSLYVGGVCHFMPPSLASLMNWLPTASRIGATVTSGPDFAYRLVTRSVSPKGLDLSRLRMTGSGGEALRIDTIRRFEERFGLHHTSMGGYGQAESVMCISMGIPGKPLRVDENGNVDNGRPLPGIEVRIVDEMGQPLNPGHVGEITARGPTIFERYLDDEEATRETLREGWLYTGDHGYLDEDGYLFVIGRKKLLIKRGASVISPREVEVAADRTEGVRFSLAIGVPRESRISSEDLVVLSEVKPEFADTQEKRSMLMESIARSVAEQTGHAPSDVVLLKPRSMPRTANGKVQHIRARALYLDQKLDVLG